MKVLESDAERMTVSHNASRQLAYAAGLLPRNVVAPEWVQFGLGSFFETPRGEPWPSPAGVSAVHMDNWKNLVQKKSEGTAAEVLKKVVTDRYFRQAVGVADDAEHATALAKARAASWALTYYLAKRKPDRLKAYFEELNKLPRDLDLDEDVLLSAFARAIGAMDGNRKISPSILVQFASDWQGAMAECKARTKERWPFSTPSRT